MNRKLPQTLAVLLGILVPFGRAFGMVPFTLVYFLAGCLFGYLWPKRSWRWGFWVAGPLIVILVLSVVFAGYADSFLKDDLPLMLLAVAAACIGSFIASFVRQRQSKNVSSRSVSS